MSEAPKPSRRNNHPEDDLQIDCVSWFRERYPELAPLLFHPNNEAFFGAGKTMQQRARAGKRAKDMGVMPGVADLVLLYPSSGYHGLMIEMKAKKGRQQEGQKDWQSVVERYGYKYVICKARLDFHKIIEQYTGIKPMDADEAAVQRLFGRGVKLHRENKL